MDNLGCVSLEDGCDFLTDSENNPVEIGIGGVAGADVQFGHSISTSTEVQIWAKVVASPTLNCLTVGVVAECHGRKNRNKCQGIDAQGS